MKMRTLQQGKETESSEKSKMTQEQVQKYCDLTAAYRKRTGLNPDAAKIAEIGKKARRLA